MERKRVAEAAKGVGRPKVGGHFELVDQEGRPFTEENLKGKYALVCLSEFLGMQLSGGHREGVIDDEDGQQLIQGTIGLFRFHALPRHLSRGT